MLVTCFCEILLCICYSYSTDRPHIFVSKLESTITLTSSSTTTTTSTTSTSTKTTSTSTTSTTTIPYSPCSRNFCCTSGYSKPCALNGCACNCTALSGQEASIICPICVGQGPSDYMGGGTCYYNAYYYSTC